MTGTGRGRPILVLRHTETERLGRLEGPLRAAGIEIDERARGRDDPPPPAEAGRYGALISLGGPMSANDTATDRFLARELELLRAAAAADVPVLGICLGAQLLARALGAEVRPNSAGPELGWYPVSFTCEAEEEPLLKGLHLPERVFQWHWDTFDLPADARPLAESTSCANQAFAAGSALLGLQFHVEVDGRTADEWAAAAERADLEQVGLTRELMAEHSRRHEARQIAFAEALANRFADLARGR